jgi:hypothetical protein
MSYFRAARLFDEKQRLYFAKLRNPHSSGIRKSVHTINKEKNRSVYLKRPLNL